MNDTTKEWEKEFDKVFEEGFSIYGESYEVYSPDKFGHYLKSFISTLLSSQKQAVEKLIESKRLKNRPGRAKLIGDQIYDEALADILNALHKI